jgi:hypothetical protein
MWPLTYIQLGLRLEETLTILGIDQEDNTVDLGKVILPDTAGYVIIALKSQQTVRTIPFVDNNDTYVMSLLDSCSSYGCRATFYLADVHQDQRL